MKKAIIETSSPYYSAYGEYIEDGKHKYLSPNRAIGDEKEALDIARGYARRTDVIRAWVNYTDDNGEVSSIITIKSCQ